MVKNKLSSLPKISIERLEKNISELGNIGRNPQDGGVYRMGFTPDDMKARHWLIEKIKKAGLYGYMDGAANVFGVDNRAQSKSSFLIGSHLDSVPRAGIFDGVLGVLVALECMQVIKENNIELKENLELIATSDEEGRFGGMIGAEAVCGELTLERIRTSVDVNGVTLESALKDCDISPEDVIKAKRNTDLFSGFLELHIEQGPVLESNDKEIGIVESISGIFHWNVVLIGEANHSGTTPMNLRKDAFQGLSEFANEIPRILEENGTKDARANVGNVKLIPPNPHTVAGRVEFSIVGRDFNQVAIDQLEIGFKKAMSAICLRRGLKFEIKELSSIKPTICNNEFTRILEDEANKLGVSHMRLPSGAGHDAQFFGNHMPAGMIFIPSLNGISHSPKEWSSLDHIEKGTKVLLGALLSLLKK